MQGSKIFNGVDTSQAAGMDQAHEQVADSCTVPGFIKQGIFAVQNSLFQGALAQIVVQ